MDAKLRTKVINCPDRGREVEVTYTVFGRWYAPTYDVVSCPAISDSGVGCGRRCRPLLAGLTDYQPSLLGRI